MGPSEGSIDDVDSLHSELRHVLTVARENDVEVEGGYTFRTDETDADFEVQIWRVE